MHGILARDTYLNLLVIVLLLLVILIRLLNPPTEDAKTEPPGNLAVCIYWQQGPIDVDLWADGPGETRPVGYSNRGGVYWNLLRDDLGEQFDPTDVNFECTYSRGIRAGEHTLNTHCYRCKSPPVTVKMEVSVTTGESGTKGNVRVLATTTVKLTRQGEEKTALRFRLRADGTVEPGSLHNVFRPLRSAKK